MRTLGFVNVAGDAPIENSYSLRAVCDNCGTRGSVRFRKGQKRLTTVCPQCGCVAFRALPREWSGP